MDIAKIYIILAHSLPKQLARTIQRLDDGKSFFYIHIDLNADIEPFQKEINHKNTKFISERERCFWGDYSIIKATLNLMKAVEKDERKGFVILMSGQDYPIKSCREINEFLFENQRYNFIDAIPIEKKWNKKMVRDKVYHYHILHSEKRGHSNSYAPFFHTDIWQKLRIFIHFFKGRLSYSNLKKVFCFPQRTPIFAKQYAGSQWWALNEVTFKKIMGYIAQYNEDLESYYKNTSAPDEIFFQSVLKYLQEKDVSIELKPSLTYANWERKGCSLPVVFGQGDWEELKSQRYKLFARKFDINFDEEILNLLDK